MRFGDREDVYQAGAAWNAPPGHVPGEARTRDRDRTVQSNSGTPPDRGCHGEEHAGDTGQVSPRGEATRAGSGPPARPGHPVAPPPCGKSSPRPASTRTAPFRPNLQTVAHQAGPRHRRGRLPPPPHRWQPPQRTSLPRARHQTAVHDLDAHRLLRTRVFGGLISEYRYAT
jgi:hypothetical protein